MEINISEEEQRQYFLNWFNEKEIQLECEVPVFCRSVDLVAYDNKKNQITAIEFKTRNWKRAIEQVLSISNSFDFLEICIRKPFTKETQKNIIEYCSNYGIGVYFFDIERRKFEHVLLPLKVKKIWNTQKMQIIDFMSKGECYAG